MLPSPPSAPPPASPPNPSQVDVASTDETSFPIAFPLVGLGTSAGGLAALETFFSGMPAGRDPGMAFVIVQHLAPDHKSILAELVARYTTMPVSEIEDGTLVEPNHVYIIAPGRDLALEGDRLRLLEPKSPRGHRLPIDFFFRTLAEGLRERSIAVVLSGTGHDGTLGVRAVKGAGGMAMAQAPATTEHDGMPLSAIATGLVDFVLPPGEMPGQLLSYVRHAFGALRDGGDVPDDSLAKSVAVMLRAQTGHDFSQYKATTLIRRVHRRMAVHQINVPADYLRFAGESPAELEALFHDLLIGVTSFFRDPEAFRVIEEKVVPQIFARKSIHDPIRVWTSGCSTGEEAYSLAILFQERIEAGKRPYKVQIFATDLDRHAIETARAGIFPGSIAADVSPERLARYFTHDPDRDVYRVQKVVRDLLVFSEHDLIKDPPFSKLDLISCRNLLIYLNPEIQRELIPLFHYALAPGGFLFLGTSETVGEFTRLFTPIDRKWKIYLREAAETGIGRTRFPQFSPAVDDARRSAARREPGAGGGRTLRELTERSLLEHYAEAGVLINRRGDILYITGRTGKYLEPPSGDPHLNVLTMAREGLRGELTTALHKAVAERQPVQYRGLKVKSDGAVTVTDLAIRPVAADSEPGRSDLYLLVLQEAQPTGLDSAAVAKLGTEAQGEVARLEAELKAKDDYLQTTIEEMQTTNEELKSTNEEMQSINEEFQSTNEELETSKEELQSVNEELSTVNAELQDKLTDLSRLNDDMNNLLAGTGVGTVFVDQQLRISRFTPSATQVINLIPTDVGRPVAHVAPNLVDYPSLNEDLAEVLRTLVPKEAEVRTRNGVWYLMRIRPYRTIRNVIEGAVLTFIDISERKRANEARIASEARFLAILNSARFGLAQLEPSGRFIFLNDCQCELLGRTREALLGKRFQDLLAPEDIPAFERSMAALMAGGSEFRLVHRVSVAGRRDRRVDTRISAIRGEGGALGSLVASSIPGDDSAGAGQP